MVSQVVTWLGTAGVAGLTAFAVALFLTPLVRLAAVRLGWVARPVEDRWGRRVIARLGGVGMFAGFVTAVLAWVPLDGPVRGLLLGTALVFGLGLLDDVRRISVPLKLVGQLLIGCVVVLSGIRIELSPWPWLSIPLSVLWFVLVMNAFNLLDNMDGLAAGVGAIAAVFCAFHALLAQQWLVVTLSGVLVGVCAGFLFFNFPPAKIFMGDSGSHVLGLNLAALALLGSWRHSTQLLSVLAVPSLVLAVPIFDTCFVTIQRLVHRQSPFIGGTDHVSHRLAVLGLSVRRTVLALYGVSACLGALSLTSVFLKPAAALVIWLFVLITLVLVGLYLSRVKVYRLEQPDAAADLSTLARPVTLIETMLLHKRRLLEILVDFAIVCGTYVAAYLLRFEGAMSGEVQRLLLQSLPVVLVAKVGSFAVCGLYRGVWRYLSLPDLITVFKAVTLGSLASLLALLYLWRFEGYSRAVLIIDWVLTFMAIGGSRVVERLLNEWIHAAVERGVPVLIIGAGDTGERVCRYLQHGARPPCRVVGFLDDDVRKHGNLIHGCRVLGGRASLPAILRAHQARQVLVAISDPPGALLEEVRRSCEPLGVTWQVVTAGIVNA